MNYDGRRCNSIHRVNTFGIAQDSVASAPKEKLEETIRKVKEKTGELKNAAGQPSRNS
jgi:hypothetical protein